MSIDPKRVKEIFLEAAELSDEGVRVAYLDRACGGDVGLRERVEALLRSHVPDGSFLGTPAAVVPCPDPDGTIAFDSSDLDDGSAYPDSDHESYDLKFLSPPTRHDSLGRLGHYEVLQVLGKGGFGIVFRAFDDILQRVVAVKVMAPQMAALSPARKRFVREARSSAAIRHENVVQIYEVAEQPLPYLVMEFIPGETLQQKLDRSGPLEVSEVLKIGRQIAEGLTAAHACDLIHRDIKPGNILLEGGQHKVKLTDFGLARAADDASISQSGIVAGTPMFMSPEQALGHKIDQRADLFCFGSVLYQMVSGRPPFRAPSTLAVLKRVAEEPPRPIPEIIPETPDWLCGIIAKLHAKNPDDRFQSAREVADLLADCEAKLKAKQAVKNILPAAVKPDGRKWVAAATLVLLPVIALAMTEFAGVTQLFRGPQSTEPQPDEVAKQKQIDSSKPSNEPPPVPLAEQDPPPPSLEMKSLPIPVAPFTDADLQRIAALPAAEQVEEVRKELQRRNPGFDGTMTHKIENGVVTELRVVTDQVTDIAPIRVFNSLQVLDLSGTTTNYHGNSQLADLSPLKGMNLAGLTYLDLNWTQVGNAGLVHFQDCKNLWFLGLDSTQVTDAGLANFKDCTSLRYLSLSRTKVGDAGLAHFQDCKQLTHLRLGGTPVSDAGLAYFKDCKSLRSLYVNSTLVSDAGLALFEGCKELTMLHLQSTRVSDAGLAHFKDCKKLTRLVIALTKVTDLSLIKEMPLKELDCDFRPERDAEILRSIKTLETINGKPAAEFWKEVEEQAASAVHDTWIKANALLPLDQHAAAVSAKLKERIPGFEDAMLRTIPGLAGDTQAVLVAAWLRERNPAFEGEMTHEIEDGVVTSLEVSSPLVQDLMPLEALAGLKSFTGRGTLGYDNQATRDAVVLQALTALETINGKPVAQFWKDAEARQAKFKEYLQLVPTLTVEQQVAAVVAKLRERNPGLDGTATHKLENGVVTKLSFIPSNGQDVLTDLSPLRALPGLTSLNLWSCSGLEDLEPLKGLKLTMLLIGSLDVSLQVRDLEPLRGMPLTELSLYRCQVQDLEPLKDMPLAKLTLFSRQVRTCEPLKGLPLTTLGLGYCSQIEDFTPLKDLALTGLHLNNCKVRDLEPFKGMKLTGLQLSGAPVRDLELLKGMPLKKLSIQKTGVTDLRPLQGMELDEIHLTPKNITQGLEILRDMQNLKTIGVDYNQAWPAAEFWERYDNGEFTQ